MLNVYLAGKIDRQYGSWRDALLGTHRDLWSLDRSPRWELPHQSPETDLPPPAWPTEPNHWVLDLHNYVGPYRIVAPAAPKHMGVFHGTEWIGQHGWMDPSMCEHITAACCAALRRADLVFAYINTPDCFGTLIEIGYAQALGKFVFVQTEDGAEWDGDDYWFAEMMTRGQRAWYPTTDVKAIEDPAARICAMFREALIEYAMYPHESMQGGGHAEVAASFANIAKWTSDPRVRNEAQRMLKRLGEGG